MKSSYSHKAYYASGHTLIVEYQREYGAGGPIMSATHKRTEIIVSTATCTPHKLTTVTHHTKKPL